MLYGGRCGRSLPRRRPAWTTPPSAGRIIVIVIVILIVILIVIEIVAVTVTVIVIEIVTVIVLVIVIVIEIVTGPLRLRLGETFYYDYY